MSRVKAILMLDPDRRAEQMNYISERAEDIHEIGDMLWASITEDQAERFSAQGVTVQIFADADLIELPAVVFNPSDAEPEPPAGLAATPPKGDETAYYLVQFVAPPEAEWISYIEGEDIGGIYVEDIPMQVALFRLTGTQATQVQELEYVSWLGLYHPAYALHYELAGREEPFGATELRNLQVDPEQIIAIDTGALEISFFDDVTSAEKIPAVQAAGATVVADTGYNLVINITADLIVDLLKIDSIQAIERHLPAELANQRAGIIIGADQIRSFRNIDFLVNLDGENEIAGVIDSGFDAGGSNPPAGADPAIHPDLLDPVLGRRIQFNNLYAASNPANTADTIPHGTHVVGSIAGNGAQTAAFPGPPPANPSNVIGMAPRCQIILHSLRNVPAGVAIDPTGFINGFSAAHRAGARVHSNSWGRTGGMGIVSNNGYNNVSRTIDRFAFLNPEDVILFASHNHERDAVAPNGILDMRYLPRESLSKNILCIGASENLTNADGNNQSYRATFPGRYNNAAFNASAGPPPTAGDFPISDNANDMALFSNRGRVFLPATPAARRRIKPDLVAPGTNIISTGSKPATGGTLPFPVGDNRRPNTAPPDFYYVSSGTSMATPIAAGAAVLTRQYYRTFFGQLRRPLLLQRVDRLIDLPVVAPHQDGIVAAWILRDAASGQNNIVGAHYSRQLVQRETNPVQLFANVGDSPAPGLARHGNNTLLLHRAGDNTIRLSLFDQNLAIVNTFGTAGTVTLTPASRSEENRRPSLCVHGNEVAVVWNETGVNKVRFQRFQADTGTAIDVSAVEIGNMRQTSSHPWLVHNGTHYAAVWIHLDGSDYKLQMRLIDNSGTPVGTQPATLLTQTDEIRNAHLAWDTLQNQFLLVWVDTRRAGGEDIYRLVVDANGNPVGTAEKITLAPEPVTLRRPFIAKHPSVGYALLWEDDTQTNNFDVYLTFLDNNGAPDGRITGNRLRISDTPEPTSGFSCLVDSDGILPVWHSNDEINSDLLGVYALNITSNGRFQAQVDPNTPLINSGSYVPHMIAEQDATFAPLVAMAWNGGNYLFLRTSSDGIAAQLCLMRTNGDNLLDTSYGRAGALALDLDISYWSICLHWAETRIVASSSFLSHRLYLFDNDGNRINSFGTNGVRQFGDTVAFSVSPQIGHRGSGNHFRILFTFGRQGTPLHDIRYAVLNRQGNFVVGARNLCQAEGTAQHGWFHYVHSDSPQHSIFTWHRTDASTGHMAVYVNRIRYSNSTKQHATDLTLTTIAGDSQNAVIAPRPVLFDPPIPLPAHANRDSRRREYGIVWQNRPAAGDNWRILFSRLNRNGTVNTTNVPSPTHDVVVVNIPGQHATDPQLLWHTNGYGLAWLQQPTGGGVHRLFFTIIDENGARVNLTPGGAATLAPNHPVSDPASDVQRYHMVWNGRSFRITWTEIKAGKLRHMQSAIAVPRQEPMVGPNVGYDRPYQHPTSALIRATLINGATNIRRTALPNIGNDPNDGYGWGRVNLRQSLAPLSPVTCHVRDDNSVAPGRRIRYSFYLPPNTQLLRVTLAWTDPPRNQLVNNLNLQLTTPAFGANPSRVYVGNRWGAGANAQFSDPLPTPPPANPFEGIHNVEQIVIPGNPTLPSGNYIVEVIGGPFRNNAFQQFPGQPFALVFVGSGAEARFAGLPAAAPIPFY
ncbi:S8 family serine peptidase [candidate division KSB1 bacterium]|nr:S8 family serine peptidase [candidate division KSB1 bacterium]